MASIVQSFHEDVLSNAQLMGKDFKKRVKRHKGGGRDNGCFLSRSMDRVLVTWGIWREKLNNKMNGKFHLSCCLQGMGDWLSSYLKTPYYKIGQRPAV